MADNEIIKALECHIKRHCWNGCPNATEERQLLGRPCSQIIAEDALDLINRQRAEIERYKGVIKILEKDVATAKSEVIKEFVERLLDECLEYPLRDGDLTILINRRDFDNLVKEMTEGVKDDD